MQVELIYPRIKFISGMNGAQKPLDEIEITGIYVSEAYINSQIIMISAQKITPY